MIRLDFVSTLALSLTGFLLLVFVSWLFYNYRRHRDREDESQFLQQCPYCTYLFFDYQDQTIKHCPRCRSLIKMEKETPPP